MSDVPEDIQVTAKTVADTWIKHQTGQKRLHEVIADALFAERNRRVWRKVVRAPPPEKS